MAPARARPPKSRNSPLKRQKSGIFTGVFNFVSQEVHNFVASATGTANSQEPDDDEELSDSGSDEEEYDEVEQLNVPPPARKSRSSRPSTPPRSKRTLGAQRREVIPHLRPILSRRPSHPRMPGSLIPMSPPSSEAGPDDDYPPKHVHFDGTSPETAVDLTDREATLSPKSRPPVPRTPPPKSSTRSPPSSVKAAVEKFCQTATSVGPSILLPNHPSPTRMKPSKTRDPLRQSPPIPTRPHKGKAPANPYDRNFKTTPDEEQQERQTHPTVRPMSPDPDTGTPLGPDSELKIKLLEEEVRQLREELARRPPPLTFSTSFAPPPPPPPPPPPNGAIYKIPTNAGNPDALFASARAALKPTTPPKEKPINRLGKACVGVPPDKMAAFLTEMKTVRLKKVSDRSFSSEGNTSQSFSLDRSNIDFHLGEKRKRRHEDDHIPLELDRLLKRRSFASTSDRTFNSSYGARNASTSFESNSSTSFSRPQPSRSHNIAPTPSLCSDQDGESHDDPAPSTPPNSFAKIRPPTPPLRKGISSDILPQEIHYEEEISFHLPTKEATANRDSQAQTLFDKRPPVSPLPDKSPRRPRPPARVGHARRIVIESEDEDEDPLSLSFTSQPRQSLLRSSATSKIPRPSRMIGRRRKTLDEEIKSASMTMRREDLDELLDTHVFTGVGTMEQRGFLAHGGAGGPAVYMDPGDL